MGGGLIQLALCGGVGSIDSCITSGWASWVRRDSGSSISKPCSITAGGDHSVPTGGAVACWWLHAIPCVCSMEDYDHAAAKVQPILEEAAATAAAAVDTHAAAAAKVGVHSYSNGFE